MTLLELQNIFGERINVTLDNSLTPEQRFIENETSMLVCKLGKEMIKNADVILRTEKLAAQNRELQKSCIMTLIKGDDEQ